MTKDIVDAKSAVKVAKAYLGDLLADESPTNVGLEELEYDEHDNVWHVTLGFSRPWNSIRNPLTAITGEPMQRRSYHILTVRPNGEVISFKRREGLN